MPGLTGSPAPTTGYHGSMASEQRHPGGDCDVLVIGAGLAGLRCASVLHERGLAVTVWDAADTIGGRVRTDVVDGFRCDRGFQVLNPAYPELPRAVDVSSLRIQPFEAGMVLRDQDRSRVWAHPLRSPGRLPRMLATAGLGVRELWALARWVSPALRAGALTAPTRDDSLYAALERARVHGLPRRVLDQFLAGVVLDDRGTTSNAFVLLLVRMFALGVPGLPADGMQALPRAIAAPIADRIELQRRVNQVERDGSGWTVTDGHDVVRTRHVVVATDASTAKTLTGVPAPQMKGVVTDWWAADRPLPGPAMLWVDARPTPSGPLVNAAVISKAAPTYAPAGRHLVAASALLGPGSEPPSQAAMQSHAGEILGTDSSRWSLIARHVIPEALPVQPPPLRVRRSIRVDDGLWVCGDHRDTASIQGALVSGRRVAEAIAASP